MSAGPVRCDALANSVTRTREVRGEPLRRVTPNTFCAACRTITARRERTSLEGWAICVIHLSETR